MGKQKLRRSLAKSKKEYSSHIRNLVPSLLINIGINSSKNIQLFCNSGNSNCRISANSKYGANHTWHLFLFWK